MVEALARGHAAAGHAVRVAAVLGPNERTHPFVRSLETTGVEVEPLTLPGRAYARERSAIRAICRRFHPAVVHTHGARPDVVDSGIARDLGIPLVTTVHGFTGGGWKNRFYEWLQLRAFRRADTVVAVSRPLVDRLHASGVQRERVQLVPNAWAGGAAMLARDEARRALGVPSDRYLVGWVGRLSREKGPDVLVEALALLADLPFIAALIGAGPDLGRLQARAADLELANRVRWPGLMPDAGRLFAAFDVFLLSSRTEGTPIVLFEAMAAGVPVVATRVGGVPGVIGGEEGILVPSEDPVALAAAVRATFTDPAAASARTAAARRRLATEFAVGPWLDRYEEIYRALQAHSARR